MTQDSMPKFPLPLDDVRQKIDVSFLTQYYDHWYDMFAREKQEGRTDDEKDRNNATYLTQVYNYICKLDFYFELTHQMIRLKGAELVPFCQVIKPGQKRLLAAAMAQEKSKKPTRIVVLKYRRGGFSTLIELCQYVKTKRQIGSLGIVLAHEKKSASFLFDMFRTAFIYDRNPRPGFLGKDSLDYYDTEDITSESRLKHTKKGRFAWDDWSKEELGGGGVEVMSGFNADSARGFGSQRIHASEIEFWRDAGATFKGLNETLPQIVNSSMFIESTGEQNGGWFHQMYFKTVKDGYERMFFPWNEDPENATAFQCDDERHDFERDLDHQEALYLSEHILSLEQLNWRRLKLNEPGSDGDVNKFKSEYPLTAEEAFSGSGGRAFFAPTIILAHSEHAQAVLQKGKFWRFSFIKNNNGEFGIELDNYGALHIWEQPLAEHEYVIGVDTASDVEVASHELDNTVIQVVDRGNYKFDRTARLEQVAEYCYRVEPDVLADYVRAIAEKYNRAWVAVEINGYGWATLNKLIKTHRYPFIMHRPNLELKETMEILRSGAGGKMMTLKGESTSHYGWHMNDESRKACLDYLRSHLRDGSIKINSAKLVSELSTFVTNKGKPMGSKGNHDDRVIALAIALQCDIYTPRGYYRVASRPTDISEDWEKALEELDMQKELAAARGDSVFCM